MRQRGDYNVRGTAAVLDDYSYTYSSLEPLVAGATWYTVHPSTIQATESEVRGSVSRGKTPYEQGLPHYTCHKQSNAFLMLRRRSAVSPSNVDPLRSTTLRGVRSARRSRGNSSALNRKSCHAPVSVMLEKRGGCCRTDGPRWVRSCQMLHTIAAINAAWCRSLR